MNNEDFEEMARVFFRDYDSFDEHRRGRRVERLAHVLSRAHRVGQRELRDKIVSLVNASADSGSDSK